MVHRSKSKRLATASLILAAATASAFVVPAAVRHSSSSVGASSLPSGGRRADDAAAAPLVVAGAPSARARRVDPRAALAQAIVRRLDGTPVPVSDLLNNQGGVSLIVLTRSFG